MIDPYFRAPVHEQGAAVAQPCPQRSHTPNR